MVTRLEGSGPATLRVPGFGRLALSYAINELGDLFGLVALAILVLDHTGDPFAVAGLFLASKFVPALLSPFLTARIDRIATRRVLPALYVAETAAFAGLALIVVTGFSLAAVLALAFVDGFIALTARSLSRAAVAAVMVPRGRLREGNAVLNVAFAVTSAVGPAAAGVLVSMAGAAAALWVDAGSFALIALLLATSTRLPPARVEHASPWRKRVREGLDEVRRQPVRTLVALQAVALVFFFLVIPIEVVYAKHTLHAGNEGFGALLAAWGVGILVGSYGFARFKDQPIASLVGVSTFLIGLGYLGMAAAPGIGLACAAAVVGGVGNGVQWISVVTAVQEAIDESMQARVIGLLESLAAAAPGLGYLVGGTLTSLWSPRAAYLLAGIGVVVIAWAMVRRLAGPQPAALPPAGPAAQ